jgi:hypothetical protein
MIKVFTSDENPGDNHAGLDFTQQIDKWLSSYAANRPQIINIHTNSNQYGWMIVIQYDLQIR